MKADEILNRLQPLNTIVDDGMSSDARKYIDAIKSMRQQGAWGRLDALAQVVEGLESIDRHYPVLLIQLADAYREVRKLEAAQRYAAKAAGSLECRTDPECQQNRAVAILFLGLILHFMDRIGDALHFYEKASRRFLEAALEWHHAVPNHARAIQCERVARQLEGCCEKVIPSPQPTGLRTSWRPRPKPPPPAMPAPLAPSTPSVSTVDILVISVCAIAVCVWVIILGIAAFTLQGATALIAFFAVLATMAAIAVIAALQVRRYTLVIPPKHCAVIEEGSQRLLVEHGHPWLLIPWRHRVRSIVPLRELTCTLEKQRASLGKTPGKNGNTYISVTFQIRYQVFEPIEATYSFCRGSGHGDASARVLSEEDLKKRWESRFQSELATALVDQVWGATEADCCAHRQQIQEYVKNDLACKAWQWGIKITELTILAMDAV